jgi:hypothetical protein
MSRKAFLSALLIAFILCGGLPLASAPVSVPAIEWQREYGGDVEAVNNLIQTSDGGYAFTSSAWSYLNWFHPSTFYKVDSSGSLQWSKTFPFFSADTVIQTNDEGYEIAGSWETHHPSTVTIKDDESNTIIKTDFQGNIQWIQNYSSVPDLGAVNATFIQTSDGGYAYVDYRGVVSATFNAGGVVKLDSNYNVQWVKNLTYTSTRSSEGTTPLSLFSLVETSDGALAVLGVGLNVQHFSKSGVINLVKTEAFLPLPSQTPLPTPISTPTPTPTPTPLPASTVEAAVIASIVAVVVSAGLLVYFKKRKRTS